MDGRYFISFVNPHTELAKGLTSFDPDEKKRERYHKVRKEKLAHHEKLNRRKKSEIEERYGGRIKILHVYRETASLACIIPEDLIEELRKDPEVLEIYPDVEVRICSQTTPWGITKVNAPAAHAVGITGSGVKVGILDTGIDTDHEDLQGNYAGGYDYVNGDSNPEDDNGHGTHVAGTVAAINNTVGVLGVSPGVSIYAYKVLNAAGSGSVVNIQAALEQCIIEGVEGVNVINMSLTGYSQFGSAFETTINDVYAAGILMVAAAGNEGHTLVAHSYNALTSTWVDETTHATNATTNDVLLPPMQTTVAGDAFYVGLQGNSGGSVLREFIFNVGTAKSVTGGVYAWQFYRDAIQAAGMITMSGLSVVNETFVVATQTFTWKTTRTTTGEVTRGTTIEEAVANIKSAIMADLAYIVIAVEISPYVVVFAYTPGSAGNSIVFTENSTNMVMNGSGYLGGSIWGSDAEWATYTSTTDGTNFFGNAGVNTLTAPVNTYSTWIPCTINGVSAHYIRAIVTTKPTAITTAPLGTQMWIDSIGWPAKYANVIAVGATQNNDNLSPLSSAGPDDTLGNDDIELVAPGGYDSSNDPAINIHSCWLANGYIAKHGTSMASPHVAGVAALYWGKYKTEHGVDPSPDQVRQWLNSNARDLGDAGRDRLFGYGCVYYYIAPPPGTFIMDSLGNFVRDSSGNFVGI